MATLVTQLMIRANATTTPEGTAATVQRLMMWIIPVGVLVSGLLFNFPLGVLLYWFTSNLWTLAQQGYIIRFHPPTDEPVKVAGELGKTLAPEPGQRPQRPAKAGKAVDFSKSSSDDELAAENRVAARAGGGRGSVATRRPTASPAAARRRGPTEPGSGAGAEGPGRTSAEAVGSVPRPGQRPTGKRPAAKRPTQAKKRR